LALADGELGGAGDVVEGVGGAGVVVCIVGAGVELVLRKGSAIGMRNHVRVDVE
jgi:hypothetical protein